MQLKCLVTYCYVWITLSVWIITKTEATKCEFCGKDFVSLGRHVWRCPAKSTASVPSVPSQVITKPADNHSMNINTATAQVSVHINDGIRCICGRMCKGRKGLAMHRGSCKLAKKTNDQLSMTSATVV